MIAIISSITLCLLGALGWLLLPAEIRALFPLTHRLALLGILAFVIAAMAVLAGSYVRADESGLSHAQWSEARSDFRIGLGAHLIRAVPNQIDCMSMIAVRTARRFGTDADGDWECQ